MNYYEHHLGDYAEATAHLSILEDGAYGRLIRKYYATEHPLPKNLKDVQRLIGCRSTAERQAVERVLKEFFVCGEEGWRQARCDEEIERYRERTAKQRAISMMGVEARRGKPSVNRKSTNGTTAGQPTVNGGLTPPDSNLQSPVTSLQSPHTPDPDLRAERKPDQGSVCGSFTKIGGEPEPSNGLASPRVYQSTEDVMAELRREHQRARK